MYQKGDKRLQVLGLYAGGYGKRLYLREISRLSRIPLKTCQRVLEGLLGGGIVRAEMHGKNRYFSLNLDMIETKNLLLQSEIQRTGEFLGRYPLFKGFLKELGKPIPILVFGSYANFTAGKDSDVDLLIIAEGKSEPPFHLLPTTVHRIQLSEERFREAWEKGEMLMRKIEENHIILNNHSFFVDFFWRKHA